MKNNKSTPGKAAGDLVLQYSKSANENDKIVKDSLSTQGDALAQKLAERKEKSFNKTKNTYISNKGGSKDESFRLGGDSNILGDLDNTIDKGHQLYKSKSGRHVALPLADKNRPDTSGEIFKMEEGVSPIRTEGESKTLQQQIIEDGRKTATFKTNDPDLKTFDDVKSEEPSTIEDEIRRNTLNPATEDQVSTPTEIFAVPRNMEDY